MAGKVNPIQDYQEATNQLLAINEQRKNNNAQAKMEETLQSAQNNTLAQAAEFVASSQPASEIEQANLNPATQNILGQYGLGKPRIQKASSSSQQTTKQNIVINNKNTTITNNSISVPPNSGGPIQGRPIQYQDPGQIRFKTWLSNSFAQQNELAAKRQRDYEKRDSALERNSNKLMKKLEDTGKTIATNLNPKNMASSVGKQLKTLLFVFGFARLAKEWPNLMEKIDTIKNEVLGFFAPGGGLSKMFGGKNGEGAWDAFKKLFVGDGGILPYIRDWLRDKMSERGAAIRNVPAPDVSLSNPGESLKKIVKYLGDILGAIIDPSKVAGKTITSTANSQADEYGNKMGSKIREKDNFLVWDPYKNGGSLVNKEASRGDIAVVNGNFVGLKPGSIDKSGNLVNTPIASISQGEEIGRAISQSKETGKLKTSSVAVGFSRLSESAKRNGNVALTEDFLMKYLGEDEMRKLGLTKPTPYVYVVRNKTPEEKLIDLTAISKSHEDGQRLLKKYGGLLGGWFGGRAAGGIVGELGELHEKKGLSDTTVELRKGRNAGEADVNEKAGEYILEDPKYPAPKIYEITPEILQKIIDKITGVENLNVNINSADYIKAIETSLIPKGADINKIKPDINVDRLYSVNRDIENNNKKRAEYRKNSRLKAGIDYAQDLMKDVFSTAKEKVNNAFSGSNNVSNNSMSWKKSAKGSVIVQGKDTNQTFDVDSAIKWIDSNTNKVLQVTTYGAKKGYTTVGQSKPDNDSNGLCAGHVRRAIEAGGISTNGRPEWASLYYTKDFLPSIGFNEISINSESDLQPGDISIEESKPGTSNTMGHAAMWDGRQWVSDFKQRGRKVHGANSGILHTYRHPNAVSSRWSNEDNNIAQSDYNSNIGTSNSSMDNMLPEINITASKLDNKEISFTPQSNIETQFSSTYTKNSGNNNFASSIKETSLVDYTAALSSISIELKTIKDILKIDAETSARTLETTGNVISAIGSLKNSKTNIIPSAQNFTNEYYNQNLIG